MADPAPANPPVEGSPAMGLQAAPDPGVASPSPLASPSLLGWLRPLAEAGQGRKNGPKRVGGKAAALGRLVRDGYPVPQGWVLDAKHFAAFVEASLPKGHDLPSLVKLATTKAGVDRAARARDRILEQPLPVGLAAALAELWRAVEREARWGLAVRSSATCEDGEKTSLAGLAVSVLGVRGGPGLELAVRQVWASAFLPQALAYLARAGVRDLGMAVLLQRMVPAQAAGVLFTAPPPGLASELWPEDERLVNVTYGLGAPVVEGAAACDTVRIGRQGGAVMATAVAEKKSALVVGDAGLEEVALPEALGRRPALTGDALRDLLRHAERLEHGGGGPFDLEFAVEALGVPATAPASAGEALALARDRPHKVWILQARPLTGGGFPEGGDAETVWSRTNVGEALPGAATPLTWSIARAFSDKGFREAFGALGCHVPRGAALVGNVHGRFYLNLTAFMHVAAQVPGLSPRALLSASGGASEAVVRVLEAQSAHVSKRGFVSRLPFALPRQLAQVVRFEKEVAAYEVEARRARRGLLDLDLGLLPDDGLATTLRAASALLDRTGTLMLSCASASLAAHLMLCRLLEGVQARQRSARGAPGEASGPLSDLVDALAAGGAPALPGDLPGAGSDRGPEAFAQALEGGVHELESAGPGLALARVAEVTRGDTPACDALVAGKVHRLEDLPWGPARQALGQFLDEFGDRAVREAELATPRWREEPGPLLEMLVSSLRAPAGDPDRALARGRALADRALARLESRASAPVVAVARALVAQNQRFTRLRERMRSWVTRVLGMLRWIALDADRRLRRIDPSLPAGSVFFCTYDELLAALLSGRAEVGHVVRLRHAEHARDAARPDPPATFIGRPPPATLPPAEGTRLHGLPASGGVVEGRARVLPPGAAGLDAVLPGEILVARTTDVGLSPLFLVAAAVVTELGGPLSHAAVVAREYGVPAVVSVPGATLAIRTGDRLRVDGDRGIVERLAERPAARPTAPSTAAPESGFDLRPPAPPVDDAGS